MTALAARLDAWASTFPWTCNEPSHRHSPMAGTPCAIPECGQPLEANVECYYVTQLPRGWNDNEQAVCWRHVRDEPLRVN